MILSDRQSAELAESGRPRASWIDLLKLRQTWGTIASRALTIRSGSSSPIGFAIYLVSKGFKLEDSLVAFWIPFLGSDLGNFAEEALELAGGAGLARRSRSQGGGIPARSGWASLMAALWASNLT